MKSPNPSPARPPAPPPSPAPNDEHTGLPGLPTWPRVYLVVAGSFILWVVLLLVLTRLFA